MKELIYSAYFLDAAENHADKIGFVDGQPGGSYRATYAQHVDRVLRVGRAIEALGIGRGDRFAVMALNGHHFIEMYHAAFLGTGIINPLNLRLAPRELQYILKDSGTKVVLCDARFAEMIENVRSETEIESVVLLGDGDVPHDHRLEDLIAAADARMPTEPEESDPVVLMYTGGTTGLPKGVLIDQRAMILNLLHVMVSRPMDTDTIYLHQTPMFHASATSALLAMARGGTSVTLPSFDAGDALSAIEQHGVTNTLMVPTMAAMMFDHPDYRRERLRSLKTLAYGASPMPATLLTLIMEELPEVNLYQGYGMTEASPLLSILSPDDHRRGGDILRSAGRPVPGVRVCIQNEEGEQLPRGETGEVCARGGNFMVGYWNDEAATSEAFLGGWYHTGDAGYIDREGYLFLVDRVKDMIVTGGENVYSAEVEDAVARHPAVGQVAVIGIPSETWGEAVHAIVVLRPDMTATERDIINVAREWIAGYKVPKSIEFRSEPLPLSAAMKVLKRELREPHWAGHERRVG